MSCPIIINSNTIELNVHTSCYVGLRLTLCYLVPPVPASSPSAGTRSGGWEPLL